jgi:Animal haem peroxidase
MAPQELVDKGHGKNEPRGIKRVAHSALFEGRFGRLFRQLKPAPPLSDKQLKDLAESMREPKGSGGKLDNPKIPAGYTYFGQFVDHDITFDPVSSFQRQNDPDALVDFRSPRFDLDSVYGAGPADQPYLYDQPARLKLLIGKNKKGELDLQRNTEGVALIGDPRNDENIIVSQLQLVFVRFHNKVAAKVAGDKSVPKDQKFETAQRLVRWHYQWVVLEDFLPRIAGKAAVNDRVQRKKGEIEIDLRWYHPKNNPFMPVEFSAAAYRFGHSMVRPAYDLNQTVRDVPIFIPGEKVGEFDDLRGFRRLPELWTVDWSFFLDGVPGKSKRPQLSRKSDARLSRGLFDLPGFRQAESSLAFRNLKRGEALGLPSGQAVARRMGLKPLSDKKLGAPEPTPLWFYILKEAGLGGGQQLGPVGGQIVAEVLLGLLKGDSHSFVNARPGWNPTLGSKAGKFTLSDLVKFALS